MNRKETKQKVSKTLSFSEIYNDAGQFIGGGVTTPVSHIEAETWVDVMYEEKLNDENEWTPTEKLQIHLGGSRRAFEELGMFFLALSRYNPPESGYSSSFEFGDADFEPALHLVVHLPTDLPDVKHFTKIRNTASAFIPKE